MSAPAPAPRMVGRDEELAVLRAAFAEGRHGHARMVMVRGEAGIGKTRLVQTFLDGLDDNATPPVVIAASACVDVGPIGAPFGPIRRVLRDVHAAVGGDAMRAAAGSVAGVAALAAVVPALREDAGDTAALDPGFADALEVMLETLSESHHLVIVIEDLHWADTSTLALIKNLASTLRGRHLTIVASHRSDDVDRFHPLRPVLAELERSRAITRVDLAPLTADEVAAQVELLDARTLDGAEVRALAERSGGVPFFVEELVDLGDADLPATLRDLVLARYLRLSPEAQQLARTMAAGGVHVRDEVLTSVCGLDEAALDRALRELRDARLAESDRDGYRFRHALTREAVLDELLPSERVRVHSRYAERLAADAADPDAVSAAEQHWLDARDIPRAFDTSVTALAQSRATFAPATSVTIVERLTELWPQVPEAEKRAGATLAQLHLDAAQAWFELGAPERVLRAADEGLATGDDDPLVRAALLRQKVVAQGNTSGHPDDGLIEEAEALVAGLSSPEAQSLRTRILINIAQVEMLRGPAAWRSGHNPAGDGTAGGASEAMAAPLRQAMALARKQGDDTALAIALVTESRRLSDVVQDEPAALAPLEQAETLTGVTPATRAFVGSAHAELLARLGRYLDAARIGQAHRDATVRGGLERGIGAEFSLRAAHAQFCAGEPAPAVNDARRAMRLLGWRVRAVALRILSTHYTWNDDPTARDALLAAEERTHAEWRRLFPESRMWSADATADAICAAAAGLSEEFVDDDLAARVAHIDRTIDVEQSAAVRRYAVVTVALLARAIDAGVLRAGADPVDVNALRERVAAVIETWPSRGAAPAVAGFVRAVLADMDGEDAAARVARWAAVVDQAAQGTIPVRHRHLAGRALAAARIQAGDRDGAAAVIDRVVAEAPGHGVARIGRWSAELARRAGLATDAADTPGPAAPALTARERQVLALVAEGLTNTQIGERLFISPKTASVHVSAILAKTGAANRAEAAARFAAKP